MNAKKAKAIRRKAKQYTGHLDEIITYKKDGTVVLGECQRGAYKALKRGNVHVVV